MTLEFPEHFFRSPEDRGDEWPDFPELRSAVAWLKSFMTVNEWTARRNAAATRLYNATLGQIPSNDAGRFFEETDTVGWYLLLADAYLDHIWNYEPMFGSRVIPVLGSIGRNLELLRSVSGVDERVHRIIHAERRQPNGGLFELLVAAAYCRAGAQVSFLPEQPGRSRTHDMDVRLNNKFYAVECKRMETGEYTERERARMRELWHSSSDLLCRIERSTFCDAHFLVPIEQVPSVYLDAITKQWLTSGLPALKWNDSIAYGTIGKLDLRPLQQELSKSSILSSGTRMLELLSGRYRRHEKFIQVLRIKPGENPRYADACDLAVLLRWESLSAESIDAKARDITGKLAEATKQLPADRPGLIHIGFEAVEGDAIECARYEKIIASAGRFDPGDRPLEYVYCHYFVPESPPDGAWLFDETTQWCGIHPTHPPLGNVGLVVQENLRDGTHWNT